MIRARLGHGAAVFVLVLAVGTGFATAIAAQPGAAGSTHDVTFVDQTVGQSAFEKLASCIADRHRLIVTFLIDESGSLGQTDPNNERIAGADLALNTLASLTTGPNAASVTVQISGFSTGLLDVSAWEPLVGSSLPGLTSLIGAFANRRYGLDTDYYAALNQVQLNIAGETAALTADGSAPPCKAVLWFTDGEYSIQDRLTPLQQAIGGTRKSYAPNVDLTKPGGGAAAVAVGQNLLCQVGGTEDQIRADGVTTLTVLLSTPPDQLSPADLNFMTAVTTGQGPVPCGAPSNGSEGAVLHAANFSQLPLLFANAANQGGGGTPGPTMPAVRPCPGTACSSGEQVFTVDAGITRFHLDGVTGSPGVVVQLQGPGSTVPLVLHPGGGAATVDGASIDWSWISSTVFEVEADLPATSTAWNGQWTLTYINPSSVEIPASQAEVFYYTDIEAQPLGLANFGLGKATPFTIGLVNSASAVAVSPAVAREVAVTAAVTDPTTGTTEALTVSGPNTAGRLSTSYQPPVSLHSSVVELALTAQLTTSSGIVLAPITRTFDIPIAVPPGYPTISPARLQLSGASGKRPAYGIVNVIGGSAAACVWMSTSRITTLPASVKGVSVRADPSATSRSGCLQVPAHQARILSITATPSGAGSGAVAGSIGFVLHSARTDRNLTVRVPFTFEMARPVNIARRWWIFGLLLALGFLLPVVGLLLWNILTAKFLAPASLLYAQVPFVRLADGTIDRVHPKEDPNRDTMQVTFEDFAPSGISAGRRERSLDLAGLQFQRRLPRTVLAAPVGEASVAGGYAISNFGTGIRRGGRSALVPLSLSGTWIAWFSEDEAWRTVDRIVLPPTDGDSPVPELAGFVVILASSLSPISGSRLTADLAAHLHQRLDALIAVVAHELQVQRPRRGAGRGPRRHTDGDGPVGDTEPDPIYPDYDAAASPVVDVTVKGPPASAGKARTPLIESQSSESPADGRASADLPDPPDY